MLRLYSSGRRPAKGRLSLVKRLSTGNFLTGPRQPFLRPRQRNRVRRVPATLSTMAPGRYSATRKSRY